MNVFEIILLSIGLAMDAFAVAICKGLESKKATVKNMAIVGSWFGVFQGAMPVIGYLLGTLFASFISSVAPYISFAILLAYFSSPYFLKISVSSFTLYVFTTSYAERGAS